MSESENNSPPKATEGTGETEPVSEPTAEPEPLPPAPEPKFLTAEQIEEKAAEDAAVLEAQRQQMGLPQPELSLEERQAQLFEEINQTRQDIMDGVGNEIELQNKLERLRSELEQVNQQLTGQEAVEPTETAPILSEEEQEAITEHHLETGGEPEEDEEEELPSIPEDPYEILGLQRGASEDEIISAFRKRMKKYHPDKHNNSPASHEWALALDKARKQLLGQNNNSRYRSYENAEEYSPPGNPPSPEGPPLSENPPPPEEPPDGEPPPPPGENGSERGLSRREFLAAGAALALGGATAAAGSDKQERGPTPPAGGGTDRAGRGTEKSGFFDKYPPLGLAAVGAKGVWKVLRKILQLPFAVANIIFIKEFKWNWGMLADINEERKKMFKEEQK